MIIVTAPARSIRTKALGAKTPASAAAESPGSPGRLMLNSRPPEAAVPTRRNVRRESPASAAGKRSKAMSVSPPDADGRSGGLLDGRADAHIGAAAADIARHGVVDLRVARMGIAGQERSGGHDLARLAITALDDLQILPGMLNLLAARRVADGF